MPKRNKTGRISIILPTLNESGNLRELISGLDKAVSPYEIIVVDDKSADDTPEVLKKLKIEYKSLRVYFNNPPLGLTNSIQKGIDIAKGEFIGWMDADLSHPPEILRKMRRSLVTADVAVGSWLMAGARDSRKEYIHKFFSKLINKLCSLVFRINLTSWTSGFVLSKRVVFDGYRLVGDYGEYFIHFLEYAHSAGFKISEIPFECVSRTKGTSKTALSFAGYVKRGIKYLFMVLSVKLNRK